MKLWEKLERLKINTSDATREIEIVGEKPKTVKIRQTAENIKTSDNLIRWEKLKKRVENRDILTSNFLTSLPRTWPLSSGATKNPQISEPSALYWSKLLTFR